MWIIKMKKQWAKKKKERKKWKAFTKHPKMTLYTDTIYYISAISTFLYLPFALDPTQNTNTQMSASQERLFSSVF